MTRPPLSCVVVDDDHDWIELIHWYLKRLPAPVNAIPFASADQALEFLQRNQVDLIVTDQRMPAMDGLTFVVEVRRFDPTTPIIVVSSDESISDQAHASGASGFVRKGVLNLQLARTAERLLEGKFRSLATDGEVQSA